MRERPKSREETPKEGDGTARMPRATALQQHTLRRTKFKVKYSWGKDLSPQFPRIVHNEAAIFSKMLQIQ